MINTAVEALEKIRDRDWVENALDPQWAAQVASQALAALRAEPESEAERYKRERDEALGLLREAANFIDECGAQAGVAHILDDMIEPFLARIEQADKS